MAEHTEKVAIPPAPAARAAPVVETLHGVAVVDPYRWLEAGADPAVQQWVAEQNAYTAAILDSLPGQAAIRERVAALLSMDMLGSSWSASTPPLDAPRLRGRWSFFIRRQGDQDQLALWVREGLEGPARPLVDPNGPGMDPTTAINWWYPSGDGRLVAYGLSVSGDERSTLYVVDTATGARLPDSIPYARAATVAWLPDSSGFYYTRFPTPGSVPAGEEHYHQRVFLHRLGQDPALDEEVFGAGRFPEAYYEVVLSADGRYLLVTSHRGWSQTELFLCDRSAGQSFITLVSGPEAEYEALFAAGQLYIRTNEGAPAGRVMLVDLQHPAREHWRELIPEGGMVLQRLVRCGDYLALLGTRNALSQLRIYSLDGRLDHEVALPTLGTITEIEGTAETDELLFIFTSFLMPLSIYRYHPARGQLRSYEQVPDRLNIDDVVVRQVWYTSRDGTRVSMFLAHRGDLQRDGRRPTVLTGYGGFNVSRTPTFSPLLVLWLERGGVYALPNLRGGGEYGKTWHQAGMLGNKQNVFDDFIAAAEWLIAEGYTSPQHLAISGRSNGGLLVGAAMTQRPDLFKAVACGVPALDMLRYHHFLVARMWIPEYGCAEDPEQFTWLYAYSPYHHVDPAVRYPAVLFYTGESDMRVDPCHARKMTALLQSLNNGTGPVLLRIETGAGHGTGMPISKLIDEQVAIWSFICWQLGV